MATGRSRVELVAGYWELTRKNEIFLEWGQRELTGRRKVSSARKNCGIHRKCRERGKTGPCGWSDVGLGMRLGDWKHRVGTRVKITYLVGSQSAWPAGSQGKGASGYWRLTPGDGVRGEGWVP